MMRRGGISISSPLAAAALPLLLLLVAVAGCCFHGAADARHLPSSVPVPALLDKATENGVKAAGAAAAADGGLVLQETGGVGNGDELSIPESLQMMGGSEAAAEEEACEESNDEDCMQRRLLHDAHLDYIYTQHKGKP